MNIMIMKNGVLKAKRNLASPYPEGTDSASVRTVTTVATIRLSMTPGRNRPPAPKPRWVTIVKLRMTDRYPLKLG